MYFDKKELINVMDREGSYVLFPLLDSQEMISVTEVRYKYSRDLSVRVSVCQWVSRRSLRMDEGWISFFV